MFTVYVMANGRVVASKEYVGSPDLIAPSAWESILSQGGEAEAKKQDNVNDEQLTFELSEKVGK